MCPKMREDIIFQEITNYNPIILLVGYNLNSLGDIVYDQQDVDMVTRLQEMSYKIYSPNIKELNL